jgi:hypothetical protein
MSRIVRDGCYVNFCAAKNYERHLRDGVRARRVSGNPGMDVSNDIQLSYQLLPDTFACDLVITKINHHHHRSEAFKARVITMPQPSRLLICIASMFISYVFMLCVYIILSNTK